MVLISTTTLTSLAALYLVLRTQTARHVRKGKLTGTAGLPSNIITYKALGRTPRLFYPGWPTDTGQAQLAHRSANPRHTTTTREEQSWEF